jgi:hypothetical protein
MSIPRYKINPLFGYLKDAKEGKFCEYRDYLKLEKECSFLKDTISNCIKAVISKEAENARLKAEVERLREFTTRTIIPNEELQAQVERLTADIEQLQNRCDFLEGKQS